MKPKIYLITTIIIVQLNLFFSNIFPKYFAWFEVCVVNFGIKHCYPSKANLRINQSPISSGDRTLQGYQGNQGIKHLFSLKVVTVDSEIKGYDQRPYKTN